MKLVKLTEWRDEADFETAMEAFVPVWINAERIAFIHKDESTGKTMVFFETDVFLLVAEKPWEILELLEK